MDAALVIRGRVCGGTFIPTEPVPDVNASAELIVFASVGQRPPEEVGKSSIFELFGQAAITFRCRHRRPGQGRTRMGSSMIYLDSGVILRLVEGTVDVRLPIARIGCRHSGKASRSGLPLG